MTPVVNARSMSSTSEWNYIAHGEYLELTLPEFDASRLYRDM